MLFGMFGTIEPGAPVRFSWRSIPDFGPNSGKPYGIGAGVGLQLGYVLVVAAAVGWATGASSALFVGVVGAVLTGLNLSLTTGPVDERDYRAAGEGLRRSTRRGASTGLAVVLVCSLGGGLLAGLGGGLAGGLAAVLGIGVIAGLIAFLNFGGVASIEATALRRSLRRADAIPPHLVRFLDYAADHVLLQRIGGGYRFIHTLLLDYFADLSQQPPAPHAKP
jgi:hypothetical protein